MKVVLLNDCMHLYTHIVEKRISKYHFLLVLQNLGVLVNSSRKHTLFTMDGNVFEFDMWYTGTCGLYDCTTRSDRGVIFWCTRQYLQKGGPVCICICHGSGG